MSEQLAEKTNIQEANNVVPLISNQFGGAKSATVLNVEGKIVTLQLSQSKSNIKGEVAFSCMVEPRINDTVMCMQNDNAKYVVIAILERVDSQDMVLNFPKNVQLQAKDGCLNIVAKEKVSLFAGDKLICAAKSVTHKSEQANIAYKQTNVQGESLTAQIKTIHVLSDMLNTFAKMALQKFNHYVRRSSQSDQISAANMDRKVDGMYSMNSNTTILISKKDTKIDGERIHMG